MPRGRAVRVVGIGLGRLAAVVDEAQHNDRFFRLVSIRNSHGLRRARSRSGCGCRPCRRRGSTGCRRSRPSRSAPRTARSGCARTPASAAAPGMISFSALIIWQPLQTPSAKVSERAKKASNSSRARALNRMRLRPALPGAEHVAVGEAAAGGEALEAVQRDAPGDDVGHVHVDRLEAGAVERRRHLDLAVDALLAQDGDARAALRCAIGRGDVFCGSKVKLQRAGPDRHASRMRSYSSLRAFRVVAQRLHAVGGLGPGALQVDALLREHRAWRCA